MRAWTLAVSVAFHLCVIAGVIVSPLFATEELPEPPRTEVWVRVWAPLPTPPPEPRPRTPARDTNAAPLKAPDTVSPESPAPRPAVPGPVDFGVPGDEPPAGPFVPGAVPGDDLLLPPPPPPPPAPKPLYRVGGHIRAPRKIHDVPPRYPAIAQAGGIEGLVILEAVISEDGSVQNVRVLRGKPLLDEAATAAVRQWRFTPPLLNGEPVPVVMTVTVSFSLDKR
jgi:protein TonB